MALPSFGGLRVLALESRRATEIGALIRTFGGEPRVAPSLREVPLETNTEALEFAAALMLDEFDIVVFLTGVGARALMKVVEAVCPREVFAAALARTRVAARGPKPVAVLRELQVPVWVTAPEPNTWRELVAALDARAGERPLAGARVAVQEYGVSNLELLDALRARGARVTAVPVYQWTLPEDLQPLRDAVTTITRGEVDVVILTSGVQLAHLFQIAERMGLEHDLMRGLGAASSLRSARPPQKRSHAVASAPICGFAPEDGRARARGGGTEWRSDSDEACWKRGPAREPQPRPVARACAMSRRPPMPTALSSQLLFGLNASLTCLLIGFFEVCRCSSRSRWRTPRGGHHRVSAVHPGRQRLDLIARTVAPADPGEVTARTGRAEPPAGSGATSSGSSERRQSRTSPAAHGTRPRRVRGPRAPPAC